MGQRSEQWELAYEKIKPEIEQIRIVFLHADLSGGVLSDLQALGIAATEAVPMVEKISNELGTLSSDDKLELAAQAVDDMLKLPWYLEPLDKIAAKKLLSAIVSYLNVKAGSMGKGQSFLGSN